jgi:quercetin dioxygenase-like cupin family protein
VFRATGRETGGELLRIEFEADPGAKVIRHRHLRQHERFEMVEGALRLRIGRRVTVAGPGESVELSPGVKHGFLNPGPRTARFFVEFRPALRTDELFVALWKLEREATSLRQLLPNLLRFGSLASEHGEGFFFLASLPVSFQLAIFRALGRIARALGVKQDDDSSRCSTA